MLRRIAVVVAGIAVMLGLAAGTASAGTRVTGVPAGSSMTHDGIQPDMTHDGIHPDMTHN